MDWGVDLGREEGAGLDESVCEVRARLGSKAELMGE